VNATLQLSLSNTSPARLQTAIAERLATTSAQPLVKDFEGLQVRVTGGEGQAYVGSGLADLQHVEVVGRVGDYAFCGLDNCQCTLDGDAGNFFGHSIDSGLVIAKGSVGHSAGAMGRGGLIAVYGSAGDRVAVSLRGADLIVRGAAGALAGLGMREGTLIIGGTAGEGLGRGMRGGAIYLRGEASSISSDVEEHRLREPDRLKLGLLFLKAGIKANTGKEFRVFRPRVASG
jgi:glutamate synthase domain-containing protein 3